MLSSSFNASHEDDEEPPSDDHSHPYQNPPPPPPRGFASSPATHMRQLLIRCAELMLQSDLGAAHRLISLLSSTSSPYGDSTDRLVHQFARALTHRLNRPSSSTSTSTSAVMTMMMIPCASGGGGATLPIIRSTSTSTAAAASSSVAGGGSEALQYESSYISLNQVTPFIRFSHLTANQAILEAIEEQGGRQYSSIHILDMDTMQGVQWPPLMQAIAGRWSPPPMIRITGTGRDLDSLRRTGHRLENFAQTLGLKFQFHPLILNNSNNNNNHNQTDLLLHYLISHQRQNQNEMLAVNCVLYLHRLLRSDDYREVTLFLRTIKSMNPKVVTLAEREANHNTPNFMQRFIEALDHYTALFDSLEATLPPNSRDRLAVEQVWFGREIMDIVSTDGEERRERHQRFESWVEMMRSSGFSNLPLSPFALSQAKLLLRLHYPSEGYQLQILNDSLFLGWQNHSLFSVSSWH